MFQDTATIEQRYERFIKSVCETEIIYGLEKSEGFATSESIHYEDDEGDPIELICFWSETDLANSCSKSGWEGYSTSEISLTNFMENWCIGMENDGLFVGINFDQNMFGFEIEPLELILELIKELTKQNKQLVFKGFSDLKDMKDQIEDILN